MNPTVLEVSNLPDGFPVVDLKVRVEKVGKPFENEGQQGKWFRQSVLVSDSTGQIEVSRSWDAKDGDPYMLTPGMMVLVSARPSNKGGQLVGVQKTTFREKPQIRARAGFVTPFAVLEAQKPPDGRLGSYGPIEGDRGSTGAPVASGGHSGGIPVSQVLTPGNPVLAQSYKSGAMTEEEACELLARNYRRLQVLTRRTFLEEGTGKVTTIGPTDQEIAAWATSIFIAVGRGDVMRDTPDRGKAIAADMERLGLIGPAPEQPNRTSAELERRLTQKDAVEAVLQKARQGGYDETEPGDDPAWEYR